MRRVGDAVGIRAASLYKHFSGKGALELALVENPFDEMGSTLHRLVTAGALPRGAILPGLEAWACEPFFRVVGDPHLAQALWAFAHGTMVLELDRRFVDGSDIERTLAASARAFRSSRAEPSDG
jgi:AcrR family transcriptional regulator